MTDHSPIKLAGPILSYFAVGAAWVIEHLPNSLADYSAIGAFILLVCRLIVDVPRAWAVLRGKNETR